MDKNAIKKYAVWARRELISRVSQMAMQYGVEDTPELDGNLDSVNGRLLSEKEKKQRQALVAEIRDKGYEQVMEEVAYTWFNRFCALRFMEVNGYLPSRVRVFTDEENNFKPQIIAEAIHLELEGLDKEKVFAYKEANETEELYQYLLITQCNALSGILPVMFERIADYTELLLPDHLLREGSVIQQMIELIPEEDWRDAVQIIGWLYQYYNAEKKDDVFAALKKNVKITKENIPAATQLFTPDWIVRYMVENSLGRLWMEGHPDVSSRFLPSTEEQKRYADGARDPEDTKWHYYLDEAEQEPEVEAQLAEIRKGYAAMTPEDIRVIDPCCGSGHILAYLFDVLMQIYESYGYTTREAVRGILMHNLYGLDIDERAAQLAYFSVMMKARQYDRRFFSHTVQPHVYAIEESNHIQRRHFDFMGGSMDALCANSARNQLNGLMDALTDAKEYGSILHIEYYDWALLRQFVADNVPQGEQVSLASAGIDATTEQLEALLALGEAMAQKYDVVVTNPPYMGGSGMPPTLSDFVKENYPDSKADLCAVFIETCKNMVKNHGYQAMITMHGWMFLSGFEKLRIKLKAIDKITMAHIGAKGFEEISGEVVQTVAFVMQRQHIKNYKGSYVRLVNAGNQQEKEKVFLSGNKRYFVSESNFDVIPGNRISYWIDGTKLFGQSTIEKFFSSGGRNKTHNNEKFVRGWWEIGESAYNWRHYDNGGSSVKWYGNCLDIVNWSKNAKDFYAKHGGLLKDDVCAREGISWNGISGSRYCFKVKREEFAFSSSSPTIVANSKGVLNKTLAVLNSCVAPYVLNAINPTLQLNVGEVLSFPIVETKDANTGVDTLVENCVQISRADWDSFETSWDFARHPMVGNFGSVAEAYEYWKAVCEDRFQTLKANEEELNRIFIDIYGLQDELTPEVEDKDVTVYRVFDTKDDIPESMGGSKYALTGQDVIRSFISYAVGCMFGRYSLDEEGLILAGGPLEAGRYATFQPDEDNIIPICDDEYFADDIVGRFTQFVETVYGPDTLEENLRFIADMLGGKGTSREVIRKYFLNDFYKDHCKTYQKRPIYWLFDSGKKNGFKALIYLHRYHPGTVADVRTKYVFALQDRYRTAIDELEGRMNDAATGERVKLSKQLGKLRDQKAEIDAYQEKVKHLADQKIAIDLDDGVKHNYALFQDILAKIK